VSDYPKVGVCPWREWTQEVACWVTDNRKGNFPVTAQGWLRYRHVLRAVRAKPLRSNPWRRHFARHVMTPWEAFKTMGRK
jgi:hypothetical protein